VKIVRLEAEFSHLTIRGIAKPRFSRRSAPLCSVFCTQIQSDPDLGDSQVRRSPRRIFSARPQTGRSIRSLPIRVYWNRSPGDSRSRAKL